MYAGYTMSIEQETMNVCGMCGGDHSPKKCPAMGKLRLEVTQDNYLASDLKPNDHRGFSAAGIIVYYTDNGQRYFMLIEEFRKGKMGWNTIAGKRESKNGQLETFQETAIREFAEECDEHHIDVAIRDSILAQITDRVFWDYRAKMGLFLVEVPPMVSETGFKFWQLDDPALVLHRFAHTILKTLSQHLQKPRH